MRYLIDFSYDGTKFHGYQLQPNLRTIQNELEKAVTYLNRKKLTTIYSSGRTDKGVHANHQMAHFDIDIDITLDKLKRGLNSKLPEDIHINCAKLVDKDFHARYNSKKKEYIYKINTGEYDPTTRNHIYQHNYDLDVNVMKEAIKKFEGTHDFTSFVSSEDEREDKVRTIYKTGITKKNKIITISFQANGFMNNQVRNMVGLLIDIGSYKKEINSVDEILAKKDRTISSKTASCTGLYLRKVWY